MTQKGVDNLDDEFHNSYNYQHKGMPKPKASTFSYKGNKKKSRTIQINNEDKNIDTSNLEESEDKLDQQQIEQEQSY